MSEEEQYYDEYVEDGGGGGDEQHAQKVNGQLESLQAQLDFLSRELKTERENHQLTKQSLQLAKDDSLTLSMESLSHTTHGGMNGSLGSARSGGKGGGLSTELKSELFKLCTKHGIATSAESVKAVTEHDAISILRAMSRQISSASGEVNTGRGGTASASAGGDSGNDPMSRIRTLENELRLALGAAEDIRALKAKLIQMIDRTRAEKELKLRAEEDLAKVRKKMEIIGDHMEKLMTNLRHEATAKIRALEALRVAEANTGKWKERCAVQAQKSALKERLISELREGSKILEDQLRLMDEKYLELRIKLDWTREHGMKKLKQAEKQASTLRMKYVMAVGGSLDAVSLPDISAGNSYAGTEDNSTYASGLTQSTHGKHKKRSGTKSSRGTGSISASVGSAASLFSTGSAEPTFESISEKLRARQGGGGKEWTEEKARDLARTR